MPKINDIAQEITDYINDWSDNVSGYDSQVLKSIRGLLKELSIDVAGKIKPNIGNLRIINRIKKEFQKILKEPGYQKNVAKIRGFVNQIEENQTAYFVAQFADFKKAKAVDEIKQIAWDDTKSQLTEVGVNENIVNAATEIVSSAIRGGEDFYTLDTKLKNFIQGDKETEGIFQRYSKTILTDTLHGFSRNYDNLVAKDLDLNWFEYNGALVKTSRPWCVAMEHKQFVHRSELAKCARGDVDGKEVSLQGLKQGTNGTNVVNRCGGWNCHHHLQPISDEMVPTRLRRKFENIEPDDEELAQSRPRRR